MTYPGDLVVVASRDTEINSSIEILPNGDHIWLAESTTVALHEKTIGLLVCRRQTTSLIRRMLCRPAGYIVTPFGVGWDAIGRWEKL
jgi:hypothetical protein